MQPGGGGGGGAQYGVSPDMAQFASASTGDRGRMVGIPSSEHLPQAGVLAEAASPISSRPPAPQQRGFEELVPVAGGFQEEEALAVEEAERGPPGNRWPRQETLALLKIRSEMDAAFRDATLKGPLWEDVSRKLAELGYSRNAKKCKEKFENVHKYYKRTKEGRAGRQDGKSYRFFTQLEALHAGAASAGPSSSPPAAALAATPISVGIANTVVAGSSSARIQAPLPVSSAPPAPVRMPDLTQVAGGQAGISFSSNSEEEEEEEESEEEMEEGGEEAAPKRKRAVGRSGSMSKKMKAFFEGVMSQVMERQEAMQQRFLEAIEKREQDRMIREEAWRRQEMSRLTREHELMAQERAMAASRDTAVIAFLQKITGQTIQLPPAVTIPAAPPPQPAPTPPPPQPVHSHHQQQPPQQKTQITEMARRHQTAPSSSEVVTVEQQQPQQEIAASTGGFDSTSSRWPKAEVLALIKLRSGLETRYQEAGPKGPLWEEISAGMQRMGYKRSSKRCKEKWENINKYFKKVKESNKKRPEDAKTCPYFHELDALYRKKILGGSSGGGGVVSSSSTGAQQKQEQELVQNPITNMKEGSDVGGQSLPQAEANKGNDDNDGGSNDGSGGGGCSSSQVPTSNGGGVPPSFFGEEATTKKPEDIVKELMAGRHRQHQAVMDEYDKLDEPDCSDNIEEDEEDDDDEDEEVDGKMGYEIQFQRQNAGSSNAGGSVAAAAASAADSFLTMVQ